jgi:biopolymer transport protein ExbD
MLKSKRNLDTQVNAGSMADIAFLLLIFFLVTTTIAQDKGLGVLLPPSDDSRPDVPINDRNVCMILVNSRNQLLVEGEPMPVKNLVV